MKNNHENDKEKLNEKDEEKIKDMFFSKPTKEDEEKIKKEYTKKNKRTKNALYFFMTYFLLTSFFSFMLFDYFILNNDAISNETSEENSEMIDEIENLYDITIYTGSYLSTYKSNDYALDSNLLTIKTLNKDNTIVERKINTTSFIIKYNNYKNEKNFIPQYYVKFYNGTYSIYYYVSTIEFKENNEIIIISNKGKFHLKGIYEITTLTQSEINKWVDINTTKENEKNIENN